MLASKGKDPYGIGRKAVDSHMVAKLNGKFCKALFGCEMVDIFMKSREVF